MTELVTKFIESQVATWGQEYVDDLIDRKFMPVLTNAGWRWLYVADTSYVNHIDALDTAGVLC